MIQNYVATTADFRAIEAGIGACWRDELRDIFKKKAFLSRVMIASYDSQFAYLWVTVDTPSNNHRATTMKCCLKGYRAYKIPHKVKISDRVQSYWRAGLLPEQLSSIVRTFLGQADNIPIISGGLMVPFTALQKHKQRSLNPYITQASYKATIIHEMAHQYFNQHRLWWSSSKRRNLRYLRTALSFYRGKPNTAQSQLKLHIPNYGLRQTLLSETFAFCAEYTAACRLWPTHQIALDRSNTLWLEHLITQEKKTNLNQDDSILDTLPGHDFAFVMGRLLLEQSPLTWTKRLLGSATLS